MDVLDFSFQKPTGAGADQTKSLQGLGPNFDKSKRAGPRAEARIIEITDSSHR